MRNSTKVRADYLFIVLAVCVYACVHHRRSVGGFKVVCRGLIHLLNFDSWAAELEPVILEYFNSCDADECIESLLEVDNSTDGRIAAIIVAIELSLSRKNEERALVSHLLVVMAPHLCDDDFCRGV